MNLNLHPKGDFLMLQAMQEAEISKGGIIIPESHRKSMNQGIILEIGELAKEKINGFPPFQIGEIVIFPLHSQFTVKDDDNGTEYHFVHAGEIIAGDAGEQAQSEGGVEPLKVNRIKARESSLPSGTPERRKPLGLCTCEHYDLENTIINPNCPLHHIR